MKSIPVEILLPLSGLVLAALGFFWANIRHSHTLILTLAELHKDNIRFVISNPTKREAYIDELKPALELSNGGARLGSNIEPNSGIIPGLVIKPGAISEFIFTFPWSSHEEPEGLSSARIGIYIGWIHGEGKKVSSLRWLTSLTILPDNSFSWFTYSVKTHTLALNVSDK